MCQTVKSFRYWYNSIVLSEYMASVNEGFFIIIIKNRFRALGDEIPENYPCFPNIFENDPGYTDDIGIK